MCATYSEHCHISMKYFDSFLSDLSIYQHVICIYKLIKECQCNMVITANPLYSPEQVKLYRCQPERVAKGWEERK